MARKTTVVLEVQDKFSDPLKKFGDAAMYAEREAERLGKATDKAQHGMGGLTNVAGQVAAGLGLSFGLAQVTGLMLDAGKASLTLAMNMEQTRIGFTTLVGSAEGAQKHLDELRDFAAKTPFTFTDLTEASKKMMALGFETEKVIPTLTILGDAAAALNTGAVGIDRMSLALGQMQAKGKLSTQEMNQLTEAGVNGWKYIAKELGVTEAALRKMTEKGLVPADVAIKAILEGMQQDFGGLMAAQAETAGGKISMLTDALERLGTVLGEQATPALGFMAGGLAEGIDNGVALTEALRKGIITAEEYRNTQNRLAMFLTTTADVQEWLKYKTEESTKSFDYATIATEKYNEVSAEGTRESERFMTAKERETAAENRLRQAYEDSLPTKEEAKEASRRLREEMELMERTNRAVIKAYEDTQREQQKFIDQTSGDLLGALEDAGVSGSLLADAYGAINDVLGTSIGVTDPATLKLQEITKAFAEGKITVAEYETELRLLYTKDLPETKAKFEEARDRAAEFDEQMSRRNEYRIRVLTIYEQQGTPPGFVNPAAGDANLPGGDSGVYNPTPTNDTVPGAGGAYAAGGTSWDSPVVVGEHGPEIWTPPSAGGSFSNSTQSAGGMTFGNIYVDARGSSTSAKEIEMAVERALERAGQRADIRLRTQ